MKHFWAIARSGGAAAVWRGAWQRAATRPEGNRRMVEFLRIARGRLA
ncbi:MAG: hypothetical protein Q8Q26_14525 [Pseudorhodobacter sp.]|nr:hypothetical protein [Pseudorhodobacter sp.]